MNNYTSTFIKRSLIGSTALIFSFFIINAFRIHEYSKIYTQEKADVAIVLGAGTNNGNLSPVFRERINHAIYLYKKQLVNQIIFTGGYGTDQATSDSQIAKQYAIKMGVSPTDLIIEEKSRYTVENLIESKNIMDSLNYKTALLISDPLHMKRAMKMAEELGINCQPSPTQSSMYRSWGTKWRSLCYETFFYSIGLLTRKWK